MKSDHYPVIAAIRLKLKADKKGKGPGRKKYEESTKRTDGKKKQKYVQ